MIGVSLGLVALGVLLLFLFPWGGIVLAGEDERDLAALAEARDAVGPAWESWRGTVDELATFADQLRSQGCAWFVCAVAGSDDRAEIIARALRER